MKPLIPEAHTKRPLIILQIITNIFSWCWVAALIAIIYFLIAALFLHGSWWRLVGSVIAAFFLYHITLAYQLQRESMLRSQNNKNDNS